GRPHMWLYLTTDSYVEDVKNRQDQSRGDTTQKQGADGFVRQYAIKNERHTGRDKGAQCTARTDGTDCNSPMVFVTHHGRIGYLAHSDGGRRRNPRYRSKN